MYITNPQNRSVATNVPIVPIPLGFRVLLPHEHNECGDAYDTANTPPGECC